MHKSTSDKSSCDGTLIGKEHIGKRVIVGRVGAGTLMYIGHVEGKDGIFCGVELDRPEGKHDGTYQGVAYFHCAPRHGIFAPSYKVELLQEVRVPSRREETLVRSAMPAIAGNDMISPLSSTAATALRSTSPSMDISMASVSSMGSSYILDHSMIMSGSWNSDAMVNSQATYTIAAASGDRSRYQLLEEIECPSELIEVDDDVPYPPLDVSLVLDESRIGVDRLPIVDDNLTTPLVEYVSYDDPKQYQKQHGQAYVPDICTDQCNSYQVKESLTCAEFPSSLPMTTFIHSDTLPYKAKLSREASLERTPSEMSIDSTTFENVNSEVQPLSVHVLQQQQQQQQQQQSSLLKFCPEQDIPPTTSTEVVEFDANQNTALNRSFTITKESTPKGQAQRNKSQAEKLENLRNLEKKERPKKPRGPSVRELQNAPIPVRPPKPKPPSKAQLMMEQLKASIEADKLKPKKDIKSKLHDLLAAPPPVRRSQTPCCITDENSEQKMPSNEEGKTIPPSSPNAKRRRDEPLKAVNSRIRPVTPQQSSKITTATTPRPPAKPRQSLLPPKSTQKGPLTLRNEKMKKETARKADDFTKVASQKPPLSSIATTTTINTINTTRPKILRSGLPTTSITLPNVRKSSKPSTSMETSKTQRDEALKLKRLSDAVRGFDVLATVFNQQIGKYDKELNSVLLEKSKLESCIIALEAKCEQLVAMNAEHIRQIENVNRNHEIELDVVKERYEKQLTEYRDELTHALDEQRCVHEEEIERLSRSNQIQCANLDSKLAEAERTVEELIQDKKNLEATLSKDSDEKVAELSKEISSLIAALDIKSTEIKTLRHSNAKLQLEVEKIPSKDIEISKLKHRVRELKALVDQKTNTEKVLTSKYEELQRSARNQAVMSESMLKENDLLRYKIEEMESSTSDGEPNNAKNDNLLNYRTPQTMAPRSLRLCQSERRPSSTVPHRFSQPQMGDDVMARSVVSLYLEQGRNRLPKTNVDTIYTPEGTFTTEGRGFSRKLSFDDAHDADDEGTPRFPSTRPNEKPFTGDNDYHKEAAVTTTESVTDSGVSIGI